jgi:hypothetical protein
LLLMLLRSSDCVHLFRTIFPLQLPRDAAHKQKRPRALSIAGRV